MTIPTVKFNDGRNIAQLGYGVWRISDENAQNAVTTALETGYRHIDTAKIYGNEEGVGKAIAQSSIKCEDIFVTTKVWNSDQGFDETLKAFDLSTKKLGLDTVDLYLIHWPVPAHNKFVETWKALIRLREEKRALSIGVCNFRIVDLERLIHETGVVPVLNQIELHPLFQQKELREFHAKNNILTESWGPLGQGTVLHNSVLSEIALKHGKTVAQIILRWHIELGLIAIPKSISPKRMAENMDIFNFQLSTSDHEKIAALDKKDGRVGPLSSEFIG